MVNAGRILIMPRGEWDALTTYNMLDLVTENGVAYLSKQTNVGQDPAQDSSMTYWQPFGSSVVPDNNTIVFDSNNKLAVNIDGDTLQYDAHNSYIKVNIDGVTLKYDAINGYIYADVSSSLAGLTDVQLTNIQNGQIIAYNSVSQKFVNIDMPVGGGSKIKVTTAEAALYGQTVTLSDGVTTLSGTFSNSGEYTFEGVELTGNLTISSTDGNDRATRTLTVQYYSSYAVSLTFFEATVTVTFPYTEGASCTLSDGVTTLVATASPMAFSVPNAGTWTATVILDGISKTDTVTITTDGQTEALTIAYGTINVTYDSDFRGVSITCVNGGTTITKTAPSGGNTMSFYPPTTGTWTISGTVGGTPYSTTATVTSLSMAESATLQTIITISVTMYGAAGATITWTNADSTSGTATMDSNGEQSTTIKVIPSGSNITFTDTNVAKDPSDLTASYTKNINLTASSTTVRVMPDGALYWYGVKVVPMKGYAYLPGTSYTSIIRTNPSVTYNSLSFDLGMQGAQERGGIYATESQITGNYTTLKCYFASAYVYSYAEITGISFSPLQDNFTVDGRTKMLGLEGQDDEQSNVVKTHVNSTSMSGEYVGILLRGNPNGATSSTINALWLE